MKKVEEKDEIGEYMKLQSKQMETYDEREKRK